MSALRALPRTLISAFGGVGATKVRSWTLKEISSYHVCRKDIRATSHTKNCFFRVLFTLGSIMMYVVFRIKGLLQLGLTR